MQAEDHPRTCGEKRIACVFCHIIMGSPPHMRGKDGIIQLPVGAGGITPAHAGKSPQDGIDFFRNGDHPRTCGEKLPVLVLLRSFAGSPPHMRGKDASRALRGGNPGITPAHAGKSTFTPFFEVVFWDHPRTCGEKALIFSIWAA